MKIPLLGVPKHLWDIVSPTFDASAGILLWRVGLVLGFLFTMTWVFYATGGTAIVGILIFFIVTSFLSALFHDDLLKIWENLWNAEWGEVEL